jgi:cytoskeleton protein RodZ
MNEVATPSIGGENDNRSLIDSRSAGAMLRRAREAEGMQIDALAVLMKVPVNKLEALESGQLETLHDAVFIRALASGVCRMLKIDAAPVLQLLPQTSIPPLHAGQQGINTPFHAHHGTGNGLSLVALLFKPRSLVVLALLLAGLFLAFVPDFRKSDVSADRSVVSVPPSADTVLVEPAQVPPVDAGVGVNAPSASNAPAVSQPSAGYPASTPFLGAETPLAPPTAAHVVTEQVESPSGDILVLRAKGSSWARVVDAKGVVQLTKTLAAGDVVKSTGVLPLSVVIGRADAVDVEVRGKALGLGSVAKDNVARFEVR